MIKNISDESRNWIRLKVAAAEAEKLTGKAGFTYAALHRAVLDGVIESRRIGREVELHRPSFERYIANTNQ